jgi:acetyl esterase/lipase
MSETRRREFDFALELVTPPVPASAYRHLPCGVYASAGGVDYSYDVYLPATARDAPPVVVFVHGDAPAEVLREPRLWGQYRSWAALAAFNGMAAVTFDHASSHARTQMPTVLDQIRQLLATVGRGADDLGVDGQRIAVWSGSAGAPFGIVAALDHPSVRCQVAFYGPMDLRTDESRTTPGVEIAVLAEHSPITHLERQAGSIQPLLIAMAGLDRPEINDSIDAFVNLARELGAPVTVEVHPDGRHAFDILDDDDRSREIIMRSVQFMREHLSPP